MVSAGFIENSRDIRRWDHPFRDGCAETKATSSDKATRRAEALLAHEQGMQPAVTARRSTHGSILSRAGASGVPGAVHLSLRPDLAGPMVWRARRAEILRSTDGKEDQMSGTKDHAEGTWDKTKGKVKEEVGDVTDDRDLEAEGVEDQIKGTAKDAWGDVKDAGEKVSEGAKHAADKAREALKRAREEAGKEKEDTTDA